MKTAIILFFALLFNTSFLFAGNQPQGDGPKIKAESGATVSSFFSEGLAITSLDGKYGFINRQGYEIVSPRFELVRSFENGYAAVRQHGAWTFINKQGKKLFPPRYQAVSNFNAEGVAIVRRQDKWGFINEQGQEFLPARYERAFPFYEGKALVKYNGEWFYVNAQGEHQPAIGEDNMTALIVQD
jgi:hypothetical protein